MPTPFISSSLRGGSKWSYKNALKKAFPDSDFTINVQGEKIKVNTDDPVCHILINNSEAVSTANFINILRGKYAYIHTGSFEAEIDDLNNKVHQRLYLPDEVSPDYRMLESTVAAETLVKEISNYFGNKGISKIVLKSAISHEGQGNIFVDLNNDITLKQAVEEIQQINTTKYFLAEEQKEFPHQSRKTGESKTGYLSYRMVGIAIQEGDLGHFIASKSLSTSLDSHQQQMKYYFGEPNDTYVDPEDRGWLLKAYGPKDKYFGKGNNKIEIEPALMEKISKNMYQLYADIKTMTDEEFKQHIDQLVSRKNALASREERIAQFIIEKKPEKELVNTANLMAFKRTMDAYPPLAAAIAGTMVNTNTIDLSQLAKLNRHNKDCLEPFLNEMSRQKRFDSLQTANSDQLNYCIENYALHKDLYKQAKDLMIKKDSPIPEKQPIIATDTIQSKTGTSHYLVSRLQQAFFNEPAATIAEMPNLEALEEAASSKNNTSRLARLSLFTTSFEEESQKKEEEKWSKLSFASKNH